MTMSVDISDDDEHYSDTYSSEARTPEATKPVLLCSPFSWDKQETIGMLSQSEGQAAILMERETDCLEVYIKSTLYAEWCAVKRELIDGNASLVCDFTKFKTIMERYLRVETEHEVGLMRELIITAEASSADGVLQLGDFFHLIDTPSNTHETLSEWPHRSIKYVKSVTHKRYDTLCAILSEAFRKGNYNTDADGATLPAHLVWQSLEKVDVKLNTFGKSSLFHRYAAYSGRPDMYMTKIDPLLNTLMVVVTIADIWLSRELLGSITHHCYRDLYAQVQNLPFPPRDMVSKNKYLENSLPSPNCTPPEDRVSDTQRGMWSPEKRMSISPLTTNATKGDVLAFPEKYNLHHHRVQDQHVALFLEACRERDPESTGHIAIEDVQSILLHRFLMSLPESCLVSLSILYNDSSTPRMIRYADLLHDICRNETAYAGLNLDYHGECYQLIVLLYKKWNTRGRPDLCAGEDSTALQTPDVIQQKIAEVLGVSITPELLAIFMWHVAEPSTVPWRAYTLSALPSSGKDLRGAMRALQPLQSSFGNLRSMLMVLDEVAWCE